jgi:hypothetical protein
MSFSVSGIMLSTVKRTLIMKRSWAVARTAFAQTSDSSPAVIAMIGARPVGLSRYD